MKATREQVYIAIDSEREFQDFHWQNPDGSGDPNPLTVGENLLLIEEYIERARSEWSKESRPEVRTLNMIRKIAGIAVRCMEEHGAPHRNMGDKPVKYDDGE